MFENPFLFKGRIRRKEYALSLIIVLILVFILNIIIKESDGELFFLELTYPPLFWFLLAQGAKRCHDIGVSGWMQLVPFYFLWMLFKKGKAKTNLYGVNPKDSLLP